LAEVASEPEEAGRRSLFCPGLIGSSPKIGRIRALVPAGRECLSCAPVRSTAVPA